jgi:enediyne biosynthesis protein E4
MPGEQKPHSQIDEVRSGGSYISQNDLRVHFGLGKAEKIDLIEVRWPSGQTDTIKDVKPNQVIYVEEGKGIVRTMPFSAK